MGRMRILQIDNRSTFHDDYLLTVVVVFLKLKVKG